MKFSKSMLLVMVLCLALPFAAGAGTLEDGTAAFEKADYATAMNLLTPLADGGDAAAQDCVGTMYCEGLGVEKDPVKAVTYFEKAVAQNYSKSQNALGAMYVNGLGVEKDAQKGVALIVKAAQQGLQVAQQNAYAIYYQEAQGGNVGALHNVAYMCLNGWGGEADPTKCLSLLEVAANSGFAKSATALSGIYEKGKFGITADAEKAAYWKNIAENPPQPQPVAAAGTPADASAAGAQPAQPAQPAAP